MSPAEEPLTRRRVGLTRDTTGGDGPSWLSISAFDGYVNSLASDARGGGMRDSIDDNDDGDDPSDSGSDASDASASDNLDHLGLINPSVFGLPPSVMDEEGATRPLSARGPLPLGVDDRSEFKPVAPLTPASKKSRRRAGRPKTAITINTSLCKYDIVRSCSKKCGFKVVDDVAEPWCLFWIDTGVSVERVLGMEPYQKINHFPGMHEICRKDHLARNLSRLSRLLPKEYAFFPKTWVLPAEFADLNATIKSGGGSSRAGAPGSSTTFIAKPDNSCQGKGIFLFRSLRHISKHKNDDIIVQSYLPKPYLIDGLKFDLRVYVLVTSVDPLRVFVHRDGLARFATQKYSPPSESNLDDVCMHLTNYAINKRSEKFNWKETDDEGSKRTIESVLKLIEAKWVNSGRSTGGGSLVDEIWRRIDDVVVKTVLTVQPQLRMILAACFPSSTKAAVATMTESNGSSKLRGSNSSGGGQGVTSQCFEILGFDIFLDNKLKPWVLEVNHSPSFTCDSPLDVKVKEAVIGDTMRLLDLRLANRRKFMKEEKERIRSRLFGQSKSKNASKSASGNGATETRSSSSTQHPLSSKQTTPSPQPSPADSDQQAEARSPKEVSAENLLASYYAKTPPAVLASIDAFESTRSGSFRRVFPPTQDTDNLKLARYLRCLDAASRLYADTATTRYRREHVLRLKRLTSAANALRAKRMQHQKSTHGQVRARYMDWTDKPSAMSILERSISAAHSPDPSASDAYMLRPSSGSAGSAMGATKQQLRITEQCINDMFDKMPPSYTFSAVRGTSKMSTTQRVTSVTGLHFNGIHGAKYSARDVGPGSLVSFVTENASRFSSIPDALPPPTFHAKVNNRIVSRRPSSGPRIVSENEAKSIRENLRRQRRLNAVSDAERRRKAASNDDSVQTQSMKNTSLTQKSANGVLYGQGIRDNTLPGSSWSGGSLVDGTIVNKLIASRTASASSLASANLPSNRRPVPPQMPKPTVQAERDKIGASRFRPLKREIGKSAKLDTM